MRPDEIAHVHQGFHSFTWDHEESFIGSYRIVEGVTELLSDLRLPVVWSLTTSSFLYRIVLHLVMTL